MNSSSDPLTPLPIGTEWEQLTLYQTLEYDRILKEKEMKKLEAKKALAAQLSEQVEEGRARREKEKADDRAYAESVRRDAQKYREETNAKLRQRYQENTSKLQDFKDQVCCSCLSFPCPVALTSPFLIFGSIDFFSSSK